jgi:hypothetical protein
VYSQLATGEEELYNLRRDPLQVTSVHASRSQTARKARLAATLARLKTCAGASCNVDFRG